MDVVVLGTGTLRPQAEIASAGVVFVEDEHVLPVDLGRNTLSRMVECGFDPVAIEHFLVTHLHPDHTAELVSLLFAKKYGRTARDPVRLSGPAGLARLVDKVVEAWEWLAPDYDLTVDEQEPGRFEAAGFEVEAIRLEHGNTVDHGYRVRSPRTGQCMAFTGDTGPCDALVELGRGVDVLVAECAATDAEATPYHLSPTPLGEAAAAAGVRHLVITHLYPTTPPEEVLRGVQARFGGRVTLARDRMRVSAG